MGKIKKKGTSGQAKNYITRTQAVRKLQVTLPDFRRLCIFKGIYPREPRNKKKASKSSTQSTTFYYTKDIQYLLHEPLLAKFREQKAISKKIARSLGRNEVGDAARLERNGMPKITLDHIIRERYPTFIDALRDLDDALSLLFLFASLPSTTTVSPKVIARCQRLCHEFQHYLITTKSLRKSFLSIKGIYYQATIQGQDIMWLVPYRFVQRVSGDVDYRIMGTFVDFYATLLGFINFRLYTSIGLVYPPKFDAASDERGAELAAFTLEGRRIGETIENGNSANNVTNGHAQISNSTDIQAQLDKVSRLEEPHQEVDGADTGSENADRNDELDTFEAAAPEADDLLQPELRSNEAAALFSQLTFFISREAPRHPIEFLLRAFGCKRVGWDLVLGDGAFTHDENDLRITHQIVDRPPVAPTTASIAPEAQDHDNARLAQKTQQQGVVPGRIYVQPQWLWDSANEGKLLHPDLYAPGAALPPHLSPWMKPTKGQYDPRATLADQEVGDEAEMAVEELAQEESAESEHGVSSGDQADLHEQETIDAGMDVATSSDDSDDHAEDEEGSAAANEEDDFAGFDNDEDLDQSTDNDHEDERSQHQMELEAEAAGLAFTAIHDTTRSSGKGHRNGASKKRAAKLKKEEQELERQKMMMSRKKRKLFEKMQYSNNKKDTEAEKLRNKRRKIEKARG